MITDRIATLVFCMFLIWYDKSSLELIIWISIDVASHWCATLVAANKGEHHKKREFRYGLLRIYYENIWNTMLICCVGAEFYLILLYLKTVGKVTEDRENLGDFGVSKGFGYILKNFEFIFILFKGIFWFKGIIHVVQFINGLQDIIGVDVADRDSEIEKNEKLENKKKENEVKDSGNSAE